MAEQPLAIGVAEVAELMSCSQRHVYRLIKSGELPTVPHMGNRLLVPRQHVVDLIDQAVRPQHVRCTACWMGAHISCERGNCTCTDEFHNNNEGAGVRPDASENRAATSAQEAG